MYGRIESGELNSNAIRSAIYLRASHRANIQFSIFYSLVVLVLFEKVWDKLIQTSTPCEPFMACAFGFVCFNFDAEIT